MFFFPITKAARVRYSRARSLYTKCIEQSRQPRFYTDLAVPDTFNGRFELTALHVGLMVDRLVTGQDFGREGEKLGQALFDEMFLNMDQTCRESGVGDLGVPKHLKRMMKALKGRALTYKAGMQANSTELEQALARNLYGTMKEPPPQAVLALTAHYLKEYAALLSQRSLADFTAINVSFPVIPAYTERKQDVQTSEAA